MNESQPEVQGIPDPQAVARVMARYGVVERTARRYIERYGPDADVPNRGGGRGRPKTVRHRRNLRKAWADPEVRERRSAAVRVGRARQLSEQAGAN